MYNIQEAWEMPEVLQKKMCNYVWSFIRSSCPCQLGMITVHLKESVKEVRKPTHIAAPGKGQCRGLCEAGVWPHNSEGGAHRITSQIFMILNHKVKFLKEEGGEQQVAKDSRIEETLWNSILKALNMQFLIQLLILCQEAHQTLTPAWKSQFRTRGSYGSF